MRDVVVISTGTANLASVLAWLRRAGATPRISSDPADATNAPAVVLPGVGSFGAAMAELAAHDLVNPLRRRIDSGFPTLGICLGMQILFASSEESPGVKGLGAIDCPVRRLPPGVRVPHMGWNQVAPTRVAPDAAEPWSRALPTGQAYFANSYAAFDPPPGWNTCTTIHGVPFISAIARGPILATQFHPELSGSFGRDLLTQWLAQSLDPLAADPPQAASPSLGRSATSPSRRIIPCLDVRDGRVVKGVRFANLRDAGDPVASAAAYQEQGADEIVLLDVSATPEGRRTCLDTVRAVRAVLGIPLSVGGGVRTSEDARALLEAGADKVGINTAAVERPKIIHELAARFGSQCTVVAIDAAPEGDSWRVVVRSGRQHTALDAVRWAATAQSLGAGEILLTSLDRDGTRRGYDLDLIRAVRAAVNIPIIASGGAATAGHLADALDAGADAVLAASIFHDAQFTVADVKNALAARGKEVRA